MIAQVTPGSTDVIEVVALERELIAAKCAKTGQSTVTACIWKAPNGRHFSAPNPAKMYLVPTRSLDRIRRILAELAKLPPPPTAAVLAVVPVESKKTG
jgi:hypothetical protein